MVGLVCDPQEACEEALETNNTSYHDYVWEGTSFTEDTPLANLYAAMLSAFGTGQESFADSSEVLPGVLA